MMLNKNYVLFNGLLLMSITVLNSMSSTPCDVLAYDEFIRDGSPAAEYLTKELGRSGSPCAMTLIHGYCIASDSNNSKNGSEKDLGMALRNPNMQTKHIPNAKNFNNDWMRTQDAN